MIDRSIINKIKLAGEYLDKVIYYANLSDDILLANEEKLATMERWYLLMVDEIVDVNASLSYSLGNKVSESYRSSFFELVPLGIIDQSLADKIADSIKTRNELTHDYDKKQKSEMIADMKRFIIMYKEYMKIITEKFIKVA